MKLFQQKDVNERLVLPQYLSETDNGTRPVTQAKKKDMMDLLRYIRPVSHVFVYIFGIAEKASDIGPLGDIIIELQNNENKAEYTETT